MNNFESALVNATPLEMAQYRNHMDVVSFLQPAAKSPVTEKRARSDLSMEERALRAGVADRLKPIPRDIEDAIAHGSAEECGAAKKAKEKLQIANQKMVARAEEARQRQTTLDTYRTRTA